MLPVLVAFRYTVVISFFAIECTGNSGAQRAVALILAAQEGQPRQRITPSESGTQAPGPSSAESDFLSSEHEELGLLRTRELSTPYGSSVGPVWEPTCTQVQQYVRLDRAINQRDEEVVLWQPPAAPTEQLFYTVACTRPNQKCNGIRAGVESQCKPRSAYVLARIKSTRHSRGFYEDYISVPISCNCAIRTLREYSSFLDVFDDLRK